MSKRKALSIKNYSILKIQKARNILLSTKFKTCFSDCRTLEQNVNKYFKALDDTFHQCFKKVRIMSTNSEPKRDTEIGK